MHPNSTPTLGKHQGWHRGDPKAERRRLRVFREALLGSCPWAHQPGPSSFFLSFPLVSQLCPQAAEQKSENRLTRRHKEAESRRGCLVMHQAGRRHGEWGQRGPRNWQGALHTHTAFSCPVPSTRTCLGVGASAPPPTTSVDTPGDIRLPGRSARGLCAGAGCFHITADTGRGRALVVWMCVSTRGPRRIPENQEDAFVTLSLALINLSLPTQPGLSQCPNP